MSKVEVVYDEESIRVLEGTEAVRENTGMYIGDVQSLSGQTHCGNEVIDNSLDEIEHNSSIPHQVNVVFNVTEAGYQVYITDTGRGIPLGSLTVICTRLHSGGKSSAAYGSTGGLHGVGLTCVCAVSTNFCAMSRRAEGTQLAYLREGKLLRSERHDPFPEGNSVGTTIIYQPDKKIFTGIDTFKKDGGINVMVEQLELASVFIPNLTVRVTETKDWISDELLSTGTPDQITQFFEGLTGKTVFESDKNVSRVSWIKNKFGITSTIAKYATLSKVSEEEIGSDGISYDIGILIPRLLIPWKVIGTVNSIVINDTNSSHIVGLSNAVKQVLSKYIDHDNTKKFFLNDYKLPICGWARVRYTDATFIGQTKNHFKNKIFLKNYSEHIISALNEWEADAIRELYLLFEEDIIEKYQIYVNKNLVVTKGFKNLNLDLHNPKAYLACVTDDANRRELFIVEGDSAGGIVGRVRDNEYQAVFKLRGKPMNAEKSTEDNMYRNQRYQDLSMILGITPNDKNLDNLKFRGGIFILADADIDGCHIISLVQGFINKINPLLLEKGYVYVSNPPLYALATKNNKLFLKDHRALMDTKVSKVYQSIINIEVKNLLTERVSLLTGLAFRDFCYLVDRVGSLITEVANNLAISPGIIEQLAHCVDYLGKAPNTVEIRKMLQADLVEFYAPDNSLTIGVGKEDITISLTNLESDIRAFILPVLQNIQWDKFEVYIVTATNERKPQTFIQLYNLLSQLDSKFKVSRFKGLGEMKPADLETTCLRPSTRAFVSITKVGDVEVLESMLGIDPLARKLLVTE